MQILWFLCATLLAANPLVYQEKKTSDKPVITVRGCVDGVWLQVRSVGTGNAAGTYVERYRLIGSKQLLKEMSAQVKGHEIEVTGEVTDTGSTTHMGKTIPLGKKTRITTTAKEIPSQPSGHDDPTLAVGSYRDLKAACK